MIAKTDSTDVYNPKLLPISAASNQMHRIMSTLHSSSLENPERGAAVPPTYLSTSVNEVIIEPVFSVPKPLNIADEMGQNLAEDLSMPKKNSAHSSMSFSKDHSIEKLAKSDRKYPIEHNVEQLTTCGIPLSIVHTIEKLAISDSKDSPIKSKEASIKTGITFPTVHTIEKIFETKLLSSTQPTKKPTFGESITPGISSIKFSTEHTAAKLAVSDYHTPSDHSVEKLAVSDANSSTVPPESLAEIEIINITDEDTTSHKEPLTDQTDVNTKDNNKLETAEEVDNGSSHFESCASILNNDHSCDCSQRLSSGEPLGETNYPDTASSIFYAPPRIPWAPHTTLISYKYQELFRVETDPNGGATSCHMYMDELGDLSSEELKEAALEFISLSFSEGPDEKAHHVIGVVHGGASFLPDLLDYFADHYGFVTVNIGSLSGPESHAHCLGQYRERAYKTYSNGTFRFSPLQELSICGVKGEEYGAYFPDFVKRLESCPFTGPVLPWSKLSVVETENPRDSNDGPIFWIRPGEQTIPLTERSKRRIVKDMPVVRVTEDRQALFEDRTRPHADQIGVDGKGTRDNTAPTAAVGLLRAVNCGHPEHGGRATKDVIAFHAGDYDRMQKLFSLDFYEPPLRQCHAWLETAQLNSLRRDGLRFSRLQLRDGDVYYLPRKIVHQFQTISAVASVAWHIRFKNYFAKDGAPNLHKAKENKGAIYNEIHIVTPFSSKPAEDEEDDEDAEPAEPEIEETPPPRRRRIQRTARRRGVRRKMTTRNFRTLNYGSSTFGGVDYGATAPSLLQEPLSTDPMNSDQLNADPSSGDPLNAGLIAPPVKVTKQRAKRNIVKKVVPEGLVPAVPKRRGRKPKNATVVQDVKIDSLNVTYGAKPRDLKAIKRAASQEFAAAQMMESTIKNPKIESVLPTINENVQEGAIPQNDALSGHTLKSKLKKAKSGLKREKGINGHGSKREHQAYEVVAVKPVGNSSAINKLIIKRETSSHDDHKKRSKKEEVTYYSIKSSTFEASESSEKGSNKEDEKLTDTSIPCIEAGDSTITDQLKKNHSRDGKAKSSDKKVSRKDSADRKTEGKKRHSRLTEKWSIKKHHSDGDGSLKRHHEKTQNLLKKSDIEIPDFAEKTIEVKKEELSQKSVHENTNDLTRKPIIDGTVDLSRKPVHDEIVDLGGNPISDKTDDLGLKPISDDSDDLSRKPISDAIVDLSRKPASDDSDDLSRKPIPDAIVDLSRKPTPNSDGTDDLGRKSISGETDDLDRKPTSDEIDDLDRKPTSDDIVDLSRNPSSDETDDSSRKPTSDETDDLGGNKISDEIVDLGGKPISDETDDLNRKPNTDGSDDLGQKPKNDEMKDLGLKRHHDESERLSSKKHLEKTEDFGQNKRQEQSERSGHKSREGETDEKQRHDVTHESSRRKHSEKTRKRHDEENKKESSRKRHREEKEDVSQKQCHGEVTEKRPDAVLKKEEIIDTSHKRRLEEAEESRHKRRRSSDESRRSIDSKKETSGHSSLKEIRKSTDEKKHHSAEGKKHESSHRHSNGGDSSRSSSTSRHRHKSSSDSRHSDRASSSKHNGSHYESGSSKIVVSQRKSTSDSGKTKIDTTLSSEPVSQLSMALQSPFIATTVAKKLVHRKIDQSTSSAAGSSFLLNTLKKDRKPVKRKQPSPPPNSNVLGDIIAQMDKQRQM